MNRWVVQGMSGWTRVRSIRRFRSDVSHVRTPNELPANIGKDSQPPANRVIIRHTDMGPVRPNYTNLLRVTFATALVCGFGVFVLDRINYYYTGVGVLRPPEDYERVILNNYWGTLGQIIHAKEVFEPEDEDDVDSLVQATRDQAQTIRVVGGSLSSNFIFAPLKNLMNLRHLNRVLEITADEAGTTLKTLLNELRERGLTLRTIPSNEHATVGGVVATGSHGRQLAVGPIDEEVTQLRMVTSSRGVLQMSETEMPGIFQLAKVSLGCLGILTEVKLRCVKRFQIQEHVHIIDRDELPRKHAEWLSNSESLQYLWFPGQREVAVIRYTRPPRLRLPETRPDEQKALQPMRELLGMPAEDEHRPGLDALRSALLDRSPGDDKRWPLVVGKVELEYWRRMQGLKRVGWCDELLAVEDEGPQHVRELCVPVTRPNGSVGFDLDFMTELLEFLGKEKLSSSVHGPIVQTWSRASASPLSPAYAEDPNAMFAWITLRVFPPDELEGSDRLANLLKKTISVLRPVLEKYGAGENWATMSTDVHVDSEAIKLFRQVRHVLDRDRLFTNNFIESLLGYQDREMLNNAKAAEAAFHKKHTKEFLNELLGKTEKALEPLTLAVESARGLAPALPAEEGATERRAGNGNAS